jgi:hypothetical protein
VTALAATIRQVQDKIFEEIWRRSEERPLTQDEMIAVTRQYVAEHEPWINEKGINGLLQWVAWMSWHEGCVEFPKTIRKPKPWWQFW